MAKTFFSTLAQTMTGIVKIMTLSRCPHNSRLPAATGDTLIILGNGPSLNDTIREDYDILHDYPSMAVNFAANSDEYLRLKPRYYILADPHFFDADGSDANVTTLYKRIATLTEWPMTLFVPSNYIKKLKLPAENVNIQVFPYNCVGVEGFASFERLVYAKGLAMPRPRNILIPAIMMGLRMGYQRIYICGADHSWTRTLSVSDDNKVVTVQPHFYKDDASEKARVTQVYDNVRLHEILNSFYVAFKSYHTVKRYADSKTVDIYNATKGSFIDAFPRRSLSDLREVK